MNSSGDYTSLQEAVDAAEIGDIIYVNGSITNYGHVIINKSVNIIGPGYFFLDNYPEIINQGLAKIERLIIQNGSQNTYISGLNIDSYFTIEETSNIIIEKCLIEGDNSDTHKISDSDNIYIIRNFFKKTDPYGQRFNLSSGVSNIYIKNNILELFSFGTSTNSFGINFINNIPITTSDANSGYVFNNSKVQNNIFINKTPENDNNSNQITHNLFTSQVNPIQGNIIVDDISSIFVGYPTQGEHGKESRFTLKEDSPAIGTGYGGVDCGIFGGEEPYILSGIPSKPFITGFKAPSTAKPGDTIRVEIKAEMK